jgi:hypothetical protein
LTEARRKFPENHKVFCNKEVFEKQFGASEEHLAGESAEDREYRLTHGSSCSGLRSRYAE